MIETVKTYVTRVLTKLQVRDRLQAVVRAYDTGFVTPGQCSTAVRVGEVQSHRGGLAASIGHRGDGGGRPVGVGAVDDRHLGVFTSEGDGGGLLGA